jgi:hypothetical protein
MRKGVSALQNIQLLKWCKELSLDVFYHIIWGFPGETAEDYEEMAQLLPLITHLPPPSGSGVIRLDRFSPNFEDAERLGFANLTANVAYRHVYPLSQDALNNLAYFFSFEYRTPRDVTEYVKPLVSEIEKWQAVSRKNSLFFFEKGMYLLIFDFRPIAKRNLTFLSGLKKFLYQACDQIASFRQLLGTLSQTKSLSSINESDVSEALEELVSQKLLIKSRDYYLALATSLSNRT